MSNIEQGDAIQPPKQESQPFEAADAPNTIKESLRTARSELTVLPSGPQPDNMAQQIDYAGIMAKAFNAIPENLRGNVGDCLAIVDIAQRAGLSPFMMAGMTYVEPKSKKLCFMSQLYNSLNQPWMDGTLMHDYIGEGPEMVCVVTGVLKGERRELVHRSEPLKKAHPGFTLKKGDSSRYLSYAEGTALLAEAEKKNETVAGLSVRGSPLWQKKPQVQMFYDTSRDWIRIFNPRAVLGIYTKEELEEYPLEEAGGAQVIPIGARLTTNRVRTSEGFRDGHIKSELSKIAPDYPIDQHQLDLEDAINAKGSPKAAAGAKATAAGKKRPSAAVKAAADRAEARSKATKAKQK